MSTRAGYAGHAVRPPASRVRPGRAPTLAAEPRGCPQRPVPHAARARTARPRRRGPVPTNKQRREAAQRHLQRQLDRRTELAKRRRRNMGLVAGLVAALVVTGVILLGFGVLGGGNDKTDAAAAS